MSKILVSRIKQLRQSRDLSQRSLAIAIEKTETTIANWEHGRTGLEWFETVTKLCKVLDCSPNDLFEYDDVCITSDDGSANTTEIIQSVPKEIAQPIVTAPKLTSQQLCDRLGIDQRSLTRLAKNSSSKEDFLMRMCQEKLGEQWRVSYREGQKTYWERVD